MASWAEVAISDMRRAGAYSYTDSYARNDDTIWGRRTTSSQYVRAQLSQGRYASTDAFNTTNPDYTSDLSWIPMDNPVRTYDWTRIIQWSHVWLSTAYQDQHIQPGFENNTRVMIWDCQVWVKSKGLGQWMRVINTDSPSGEWWSPDFREYLGSFSTTPSSFRTESSTGYRSVKTVYAAHPSTGADAGIDYWLAHGYSNIASIDGPDIADIVSSFKCALVMDNPDGFDDRDYSRYLVTVGADYMPADKAVLYPGVGTSRQRFLRAKWPNWEYRVCHSMTQAQFEAVNGYPSVFVGLSEGDDSDQGGGEDPPSTPVVAPTRGSWFAKSSGGSNAWNTWAVANVPSSTMRRRRVKIWE